MARIYKGRKPTRTKKFIVIAVLLVIALLLVTAPKTGKTLANMIGGYNAPEVATMEDVPKYNGSAYVAVNGNTPDFTEKDIERLSVAGYEYYGALDSFGRCTYAEACVGPETMPAEERGSIGMVKPTGWHTVKYDCVDGKYLYNRCHLIGYQLTGENANECNLITGTRYLNIDGMLDIENEIADYVEDTGNHVMYRVTPVYDGDNLLADGVHIEAQSVEDDSILLNVFAYNVQPGVTINYENGDSHLV